MDWDKAYKKEVEKLSELHPLWDDRKITRQAEENLEKRYPL